MSRLVRRCVPFLLALLLASPQVAQQPKRRSTPQGHTDQVFSVALGPDGKTLASSGARL